MNAAQRASDTIPCPPPVGRQCPCCGEHISPEEWAEMDDVGVQDAGDGNWLLLKQHGCGSTLAQFIEVSDA